MRLCVWPLRDAVSKLNKETGLIQPETLVFMRDCLDHVAQVIDIMENYRERVSSLTDLYLSSLSNKLNEVMKVLTIFATIFMPLQFLTGIYGMNFDPHLAGNMPELELPYAYPVLLAVMGIVTGGMIYYFFRRGWLWQKNGFELSDDE